MNVCGIEDILKDSTLAKELKEKYPEKTILLFELSTLTFIARY